MLIDELQKLEYTYKIYLCKPYSPYAIIGCLDGCLQNKKIKYQINEVDEFQCDIYNVWNDSNITSNIYYEDILPSSVLLIEKYIDNDLQSRQYFYIIEVSENESSSIYKEITAYSLEYKMNKIKVKDFNFTTQIYDDIQSWTSATPTSSGFVNYLLEEKLLDTWSVNYISSSLTTSNNYRTFDISESSVYECFKLIQKEFNCLVFFDTYNQTVDIKDYDDLGGKTGLILSDRNYISKLKNSIKVDDIVTRLYVSGSDDTLVSSHTITGQGYIDDFSYFRSSSYMSSGLLSALNDYDIVVTNNTTNFDNYLSQLSTKQLELATLQSELIDLQTELSVLEDSEDGAIKNGTFDGQNYTYWHNLVLSKESDISNKQSEISSKQLEIDTVNSNLATIRSNVSYDNNFTTSELVELLSFINEDSVSFETDSGEQLLSLGESLINILSQPPIDFDLDLVSLYDCITESYTWDKLLLGYQVDILCEEINLTSSPRITMIQHDIDDQKLKVSLSNKNYYNSDTDYITNLFVKSQQVSTTVNNERTSYKSYTNDKSTILYDSSSINTSDNIITVGETNLNALASQVIMNRRGMYMRALNPSTQEVEDGQMRLTSNQIIFTQDNWDTYSLAITSAGIQTDGSFMLYSETTYGTNSIVEIDGTGMRIYGDGTTNHGIEIYDLSDTKVMGFDSSGNLTMTGTLSIIDSSGNTLIDPNNAIGNPSVAGLYLDSTYMGYHNGNGLASGWTVYIKSDGSFYFGGDTDNYLEWDGSTLTISGQFQTLSSGVLYAEMFGDTSGGYLKIYNASEVENVQIGSNPTNDSGLLLIFNGDDSATKADDIRCSLAVEEARDSGFLRLYSNYGTMIDLTSDIFGGKLYIYNIVENLAVYVGVNSSESNSGLVQVYNSAGSSRGNFYVNNTNDYGQLVLYSGTTEVVRLRGDANGSFLFMDNDSGNRIVQLGVNAGTNNTGSLFLYDDTANVRTSLYVDSTNQDGQLRLYNAAGNQTVSLQTFNGTYDTGGLYLKDASGNTRAELSVSTTYQDGGLVLKNPAGNTTINISSYTTGTYDTGFVAVGDASGNVRANLYVSSSTQDGILRLDDASGNTLLFRYNGGNFQISKSGAAWTTVA